MESSSKDTKSDEKDLASSLSSPPRTIEVATESDQKVAKVGVDIAAEHDTRQPTQTYFNLSSKEGQEHLRELNEELKALNEDGSPMLSILHCPAGSSSLDGATDTKAKHTRVISNRKKCRKRKRQMEPGHKNVYEEEDRGGLSTSKSVGAGRTGPRRLLFQSKQKEKQDETEEEEEIPIGVSEVEIDSILDEKAWRSNLTTVNVKNILRYVITNEHVLSMVKNSMTAESSTGDGSGLNEEIGAIYEPKLTRSKAKELMEKREKVPWPISPIKVSSPTKTKPLIELEFSESSSDEEYKPETDGEESFLSSQASEVDSPKITPAVKQTVVERTPTEFEEKMQIEEQNEDTIALRTRSKLPLNDTPLEFLESNFMAPDITIDMYDSECDDEDWGNFLVEFLKPLDPDPSVVLDDDANDPEYNFLEEEDIPDREDLRDDRAVKISKKEIQELMAELFEAAENELNDGEEEEDRRERQPLPPVIKPSSKEVEEEIASKPSEESETTEDECPKPLFDHSRKQQLDEQMRQYVQLLTQAFLFTSEVTALSQESETCRTLMLELESLAANSQAVYGRNRIGVIQTLQKLRHHVIEHFHRQKMSPDMVELIAHSQVFIYPELLPIAGFYPPRSCKQAFVESEDVLLALGLEQFQPLTSKNDFVTVWNMIKENMLPVKTPKQIFIRAKNLRSKKSQPNPVKYYNQFKKTQPIKHSVKHFDANCVIPPIQQPLKQLPKWLQQYIYDCKAQSRGLLQLLPSPLPTANIQEDKMSMGSLSFVPTAPLQTQAPSLESTVFLSSASPSRPISSPSVCEQPVVVPFYKTPEKMGPPVATSMPMIVGGHVATVPKVSPLKQVSPILKKYRPKRLRKTGGNLRKTLPKLHPKVVLINPSGLRPLAPKAPSVAANMADVNPLPMTKKENDDVSGEVFSEVKSSNGKEEVEVPKEVLSDPDSEAEIFDDGDDTADDEGIDMQADNEDDLAALMAASTTIKVTPKHRQNMIRKKKKKQQQEREDLLALLARDLMDSDPLKEERETAFAHAYLQKVKENVGAQDTQLFEDFLRLLHDFNHSEGNVVQLYKDVCDLLKDFPQVCEEFVAFLLPEQAMECGKYIEHLSISKMQLFLRKLEVHFGKQPHHLQKILKLLSHLQQQENVTLDELGDTMLPVLRGQTHLIEEFLQLFPQASPPESAMVDFEEVFIPDGNEEIDVDEDGYEVVELPETDDVYGTKECICDCHVSTDKSKVQNRLRHCLRCGIKFIDGRIFLQTGKVLKPCRVVYHHRQKERQMENEDKRNSQVERDYAMVASPPSSLSSLSPPLLKDSDDEHDVSESDLTETPNCSKEEDDKEGSERSDKPANPFLEALEQISQEDGTRFNLPSASTAVTEDAILTSDVSANSRTSVPTDFSTLRNVICHEKQLPSFEIHQVESAASRQSRVTAIDDGELLYKQCEDPSPNDDHVGDSQSKEGKSFANNHAIDGSGKVVVLWTREYDRILLQACKQFGPNNETFVNIASKLKTKTPGEVEERFGELMALFSSGSDAKQQQQ